MELQAKYNDCLTRKCLRSCSLQNIGHLFRLQCVYRFISAYVHFYHFTKIIQNDSLSGLKAYVILSSGNVCKCTLDYTRQCCILDNLHSVSKIYGLCRKVYAYGSIVICFVVFVLWNSSSCYLFSNSLRAVSLAPLQPSDFLKLCPSASNIILKDIDQTDQYEQARNMCVFSWMHIYFFAKRRMQAARLPVKIEIM